MKALLLASLLLVPLIAREAHATEVSISAGALERTLKAQLFNGPDGRYYVRGDRTSACYVYVDNPAVSFHDDRVNIHVQTHSRLGAGMFGKCVGLGFNTETDVSVIPESEGETIGFREARIDRFTGNKELDFILVPFLSRKLPANMKINAAEVLRTALSHSRETTGYALALDSLKIHSMLVARDRLIVDMDSTLRVD